MNCVLYPTPGLRWRILLLLTMITPCIQAEAEWRYATGGDQRHTKPPKTIDNATPIKPGDAWPNDTKFRWLIGELTVPEVIGKEPSVGKAVGLQISCGDGGEVWLEEQFQVRFDNDHRRW